MHLGMPDDAFEQRRPKRGLITKMEVRVVSLAKLCLRPGDTLWDIGTGAGSVAIEAARLVAPGQVYAIEKNAADAEIARRNVAHFGLSNITVVHGEAPAGLADWPQPDAVFIGGTSGTMAAVIGLVVKRLRPGGRVVANVATLENLHECIAAVRAHGWHADVVLLQVARSKPILNLTRLESFDPVYIITGTAQRPEEPEGGER